MGSAPVENDVITNHCPLLLLSHLTLLSSFSLFFPTFDVGIPPEHKGLGLAKAPAPLAFLIQPQELKAEAEVDSSTDKDVQKHLAPPLHLHMGKQKPREWKVFF